MDTNQLPKDAVNTLNKAIANLNLGEAQRFDIQAEAEQYREKYVIFQHVPSMKHGSHINICYLVTPKDKDDLGFRTEIELQGRTRNTDGNKEYITAQIYQYREAYEFIDENGTTCREYQKSTRKLSSSMLQVIKDDGTTIRTDVEAPPHFNDTEDNLKVDFSCCDEISTNSVIKELESILKAVEPYLREPERNVRQPS